MMFICFRKLKKIVPKLPAQRSKEYRERLKARMNESNSNL